MSELAQSVSKQYEVYSVKFLLEGEWNVESEIYWEYKPFFLSPMCFLDGPGSIQASWTFNYDAAAKTYARTITSQNGNMNLGLGVLILNQIIMSLLFILLIDLEGTLHVCVLFLIV